MLTNLRLHFYCLGFIFSCLFSNIHTASAQSINSAGNNLYFNGNSNFVDTRDTSWYQQFTVECWVKSPNAPSNAQGKGPVHYEKNFQINWDHVSSNARNALLINTQNGWRAASFGQLEANTWYHLAGTYDGDTLKTYKNGELITALIINDGPPRQEEFSLKIGKHAKLSNPTMEFFNGNVDEVRVWNVVRTADEIRRFMHHPLDSVLPTGLKHYYNFNDADTDSTLNLATGRKVPKILNPELQVSSIPFGEGTTEIYSFNADSITILPALAQGFSRLSIDSTAGSGKLMVTLINETAFGSTSGFGLVPNDKYWILKTFENDSIYKHISCQFSKDFLSTEIIDWLNSPAVALSYFNRPHTAESFDQWELNVDFLLDTPLNDFFDFNIPAEKEGQVLLYLIHEVATAPVEKGKTGVKLLGYKWGNRQLEARFSDPIQSVHLHQIAGKQIGTNLIHVPSHQFHIDLTHLQNVLKGIYLLTAITESGQIKTYKIVKN